MIIYDNDIFYHDHAACMRRSQLVRLVIDNQSMKIMVIIVILMIMMIIMIVFMTMIIIIMMIIWTRVRGQLTEDVQCRVGDQGR